jgi:hypothetical protein
MKNVKSLEEQITDAEEAVLSAELKRAAEIVWRALNKYQAFIVDETKQSRDLVEALNSNFKDFFRSDCKGGVWGARLSSALQWRVPVEMRPILAEYAAKQLLERIAAVEELAGEAMCIAESAHRQ